ncbi:MAG TPA: hypothetical protein VEL28_18815 [Candidatus Binatia bacterium]|nr:hypothetical protein [Candidatus Binatia bacterium]
MTSPVTRPIQETGPVPVVFGIDVEPDARMIARHESRPWTGMERIYEFVQSLRERLPGIDGLPAQFVWLLRMDPQIRMAYGDACWGARRHRPMLECLREMGDDIGVHTHLYDWDHEQERWVTDAHDPAWRRACVQESTDAYRRLFGTACRVHSFGDRWLSEDSLDLLEQRGIVAELSAEPGFKAVSSLFPDEGFRGTLPDLSAAPRDAWRPRRGDLQRHDPEGRPMVMVPVSTYRFPWRFEAGRRIDILRGRLRGRPVSIDQRTQRHARLYLEHRAYVFRYGYRQLMASYAPRQLHFVVNSSQARDEAALQRMQANIEWLVSEASPRGVAFVSATRLLDVLGLSRSRTGQAVSVK